MVTSFVDAILDSAVDLVLEDGFSGVSLARIASSAAISEDDLLAVFGSLQDLLVRMLNREYGRMFRVIVDNIERDPLGGLVSRIYRYTITAVYERPLARALYLTDRDGLNTIMRSSHGWTYVPELGVRAAFIDEMKAAGMVRPDVPSAAIAAILSAVSAGAALTAPHPSLDRVAEGLEHLLSAGVDADVTDTAPGKAAFFRYASSLTEGRDRH